MSEEIQVNEHIAAMTDKELITALAGAQVDLEIAANEQRNTEWHEACFAAVWLFCAEAGRRGIGNKFWS